MNKEIINILNRMERTEERMISIIDNSLERIKEISK